MTHMLISLWPLAAIIVAAFVVVKLFVRRTPLYSDSQQHKDLNALLERDREMRYRSARGHNVTREEIAKMNNDWRAHGDKYGVEP
jgi:hypothetical protein